MYVVLVIIFIIIFITAIMDSKIHGSGETVKSDFVNISDTKFTLSGNPYDICDLDLLYYQPEISRKYIYNDNPKNILLQYFTTQNINHDNIVFTNTINTWKTLQTGQIFVLLPDCNKNLRQYINTVNKKKSSFYYGIMGYGKNPKSAKCVCVWEKREPVILDPEICVQQHNLPDCSGKINVVQEAGLPGGSKQRMYSVFNVPESELIYAGPNTGLAQVAIGIIAKHANKTATVFTYYSHPVKYLTHRALQYGVKVRQYKKSLLQLQSLAENYAKKIKAYISPFGFSGCEMISALAENIKKNWKTEIPDTNATIWLVAGSATILAALYKVFPNVNYVVVQVGKTIWPDQVNENTKVYISDLKFFQPAKILPPYKSVATYDAKVWEYVIKHGKPGDYIWNVGA